jgi:hypothetical protein
MGEDAFRMGEDENDPINQTTPFSVATLRDLVSRTADMSGKPRGPAPHPPQPSSPALDVLTKGAPILVFPSSRFPPPLPPPEFEGTQVPERPAGAAPAPTPCALVERAPAPAAVETSLPSVIVESPRVEPPPVEPPAVEAPAVEPWPVEPPLAKHAEPVRARRVSRPRPRRDTVAVVEGFLKCRLVALVFLALAVAAPPWWWNIGDVRPPRALTHPRAAQSNAPAAPATNPNDDARPR